MGFDYERAKELLGKLRRRGECFDLMLDFFDRAHREENIEGMRGAYDAMLLIHKGNRQLA